MNTKTKAMRAIIASILCILTFTQFVHAQSGEYELNQIDPKAGTFTATLNGQVRTFRVRPSVETTINGIRATFEELEPGMKLKVTSAEPGTATRVVASGLRTRPAPTGAKPPMGLGSQPARQVKAEVPANSANGFPIGDVRKGTRISIQYLGGKWKHDGRIAQWNPDSDEPKVGNSNRLCVSLPATDGKAGDMLAIVPAGSSKRPFVYEADKDYPGLILRINDPDGKFDGNPGDTEWNVKIVPPTR